MKKFKKAMGIILLTSLIMTGCTPKEEGNNTNLDQTDTSSEYRTVIDILGREVTVKKEIDTMVVTPVPYPSIIYSIDKEAARKMIAVNPSAMKQYEKALFKVLAPEFADASVDYVASDFSINAEEILNLNPDVVILWSSQEDDIKKLEQVNIPVVTLEDGASSDIESMRENMRIIGQLLNKEEETEKLIAKHAEVEQHFSDRSAGIAEEDKPQVLYIRDKNLSVAAGASFNNRVIGLTGGINTAAEVKGGWTEVSMEQIISWNPEIIYLSNMDDLQPEDLYNNQIEGQDWSQISAVKNKKVYKTPVGIIRWDAPCTETPLFMEWMGQIQQPGVFNDYDISQDIQDFYREFLDYELSADELNGILNR